MKRIPLETFEKHSYDGQREIALLRAEWPGGFIPWFSNCLKAARLNMDLDWMARIAMPYEHHDLYAARSIAAHVTRSSAYAQANALREQLFKAADEQWRISIAKAFEEACRRFLWEETVEEMLHD
jgi:hypothetical protein